MKCQTKLISQYTFFDTIHTNLKFEVEVAEIHNPHNLSGSLLQKWMCAESNTVLKNGYLFEREYSPFSSSAQSFRDITKLAHSGAAKRGRGGCQ